MGAILLDGERLAGRFKMELADRAARLAAGGRPVGLGTILVGDDGPSVKYVPSTRAIISLPFDPVRRWSFVWKV